MKKLLYFAMALGLVACQAEKVDVNGGLEADNTQANYIAINIVPAPELGTRAAGDVHDGAPGDDAQYEEGYGNENKVNSVRLYFFDAKGGSAAVKKKGDGFVNYFDWTHSEGDADMPNVEKQLNAVVVIQTPEGDELPQQIVAVINPDTEGLGQTALSLTELRARMKDYVAAITDETNPGFVMTNAVYANGSNEVIATAVTERNYAPTADLAIANPVNIYVERNVAKVRVQFKGVTIESVGNGDEAYSRIALQKKDQDGTISNITGEDGKQIYLKLGKWNITAKTDFGYFSKHITSSLAVAPFTNWNYAPYFRSFWAENPTGVTQSWISYNEIDSKGGMSYGSVENSNVIYANENAPQDLPNVSVEPFTKVILAGTLVYEDGSEVEVANYAGFTTYSKEALIDALLLSLRNSGKMIYSYDSTADQDGTNNTLAELTADDVEFVTAYAAGEREEGESHPGHYNVYLQLVKGKEGLGVNKTWTTVGDKTKYEEGLFKEQPADVNKYLIDNLDKAQVYKEGMTYYYFPIQHLNDSEEGIGYYGVVRNHIYDCSISAIYGLGTPVYDPNETIWPEHPQEEDTFIAAKINILSWRIVDHNYELNW